MNKPTLVYFNPDCFVDTDITVIKYLTLDFNVIWFYLYDSSRKESMRYDASFVKNYAVKYGLKVVIVDPQLKATDYRKFFFYKKIVRLINSYNPNIVYTGIRTPYWVIASRLFLKCKNVILGIHDVKPHSYSNPLTSFIEKYLSSLSIKFNHHFFTFSPGQQQILRSQYGKESVMVGMSLKDFGVSKLKLPNIEDGVKLLFFGRIELYKGLDGLINTIEELHREGVTNIQLTIAGNGDYWNNCETCIKTPILYNLKIGYIKNEEVSDLMCSHHYLVLPYLNATQSGPLAIALAYGLPIIAPNIGCFKEVYDNKSGVLYNTDSLKDALRIVAEMDVEQYEGLRSSVLVIRDKYSELNIANNYIKAFNSFFEK